MIHDPAPGAPKDWTVICLCAEWCDTCREYRRAFEARAQAAGDALHLWVDIEDEADHLGELDIETFPTLLLLQGGAVRFFGAVLPQTDVIDGMLRSLAGDAPAIDIAPENRVAVDWLRAQARSR